MACTVGYDGVMNDWDDVAHAGAAWPRLSWLDRVRAELVAARPLHEDDT